ncbi:MAG: thioredoxin [Propionicimonas sp.]|uniref:thioredoxin n=1 Tax=Propionicimonas sp. TaxID=1955623 RepID=UPI002B1F8AD0|nr:thioredoxin [Propionicimonas sp.]MEA4944456.1 thioredoxin [Propionicimonas sp.]MEA5117170.1 thioredoxin [Propionicimonas sp.]
MAVVAVTDATFTDQVLKSPKPVLIDYWADWCAPCRQLSPIIDELAVAHGDKVTFLKLNADENPQTATNYGILGLPTIQIFVGGELVKQLQGGKTKSALLKAIEEYL